MWLSITFACGALLAVGCATSGDRTLRDGEGGAAGEGGEAGADSGEGGMQAGGAGGGTAGETGGGNEGGSNGRPQQIPVPGEILDGDVQVSCTVSCASDDNCAEASVFVSACSSTEQGLCYEVTPIDDPSGDGNTYIISINDDGDGDVLEGTTCSAPNEGDDLPVDLVFVIDTTGSMGTAIGGIKSSIDAFVDDLAERGVDVRIGGIAFGDGAPLPGCIEPDAPFQVFTETFGEGTEADPDSFNFWLNNVDAGHCGDGGGDGPENALDAIEFALGNDPLPDDAFPADAFEWNPSSLHVIMVVTDVTQHQASDGTPIAHFELEDVEADLRNFAIVHVVGPNLSCVGTPAYDCECNETPFSCDEGCACDLYCPLAGCEEDVNAFSCDDAEATCDIDCPGYPAGASCDVTAGYCDAADLEAEVPEPCAEDFDCAGGAAVGPSATRRCEPQDTGLNADVADLAVATRGTFTVLPESGVVDLTALPLTGVLTATEECEASLPADAVAVRCVYRDDDGHEGEVTVQLDDSSPDPSSGGAGGSE
jgi:hypothetical protein